MNNNSIILNSGYKYIAITFVIAIILTTLDLDTLGAIAFIITLVIGFAYSNPNRDILKDEDSILSPIDGVVTAIDKVGGKQKIYCKINLCDTPTVRAPIDSTLKIKKYQNGLNLNPNSYKASILNEQITFKFKDLKLKLISGLCSPKIEFSKKHKVKQGEGIAVFIDGIAIITIKETKKLSINIGDKLKAGQTKI